MAKQTAKRVAPVQKLPREGLIRLRERYLKGYEVAPPRLLRELAADPRAGAQSLYRALEKKKQAARSEQIRLSSMLNFEQVLWKAGITRVAGVDEVGMGCIAGPVVAAAVVLPHDVDVDSVDDSKRLDRETRERLDRELRKCAVAVSVAEVSVADIDRLNIYHAGREAMRRAILGLSPTPLHVLTDAREVPGIDIPQNAFDQGDGINYSIATASIIAKVYRDRLMTELALRYPGYGLEVHKGYGTPQHLQAVRRLGASEIHRTSFPVMRELLGGACDEFYEIKRVLDEAASLTELEQLRERIRASKDELSDAETRKLSALLGRRQRKLGRR